MIVMPSRSRANPVPQVVSCAASHPCPQFSSLYISRARPFTAPGLSGVTQSPLLTSLFPGASFLVSNCVPRTSSSMARQKGAGRPLQMSLQPWAFLHSACTSHCFFTPALGTVGGTNLQDLNCLSTSDSQVLGWL